MAICQVQHVLLLLTSLLFLPALQAVDFKYCNEIYGTPVDSGYKFGNVSHIVISPNPVGPEDDLTFKIFGSLTSASNTIEIGLVSVLIEGPVRLYTFEEAGVGSTIEPDTNFVLTLPKVPHHLPKMGNMYLVRMVDATRMRYGEYSEVLCVAFDVPTSTPTLASS